MNSITIEIESLENTCFVAMPFNNLYKIEYEEVLKPAVEELNINCIRGDEIYNNQRIMDDIWESIRSCRFVIAELTDKNPNVMYELGLAHAIGKPIIIITRKEEDVPFDLKSLRYIYYDTNNPFWGSNLKASLQDLIKKVIDNPEIGDYLEGISVQQKSPKHQIQIGAYKSTIQGIAVPEVDITGNWKGDFNPGTPHKIDIHFHQNNDEITASAVIHYYKGNELTVVQETLKGHIRGKEISITGVNYTYVQRGNGRNYLLDTFNFTLDKNNTVMTGEMESKKSKKIPVKLTKVE